MADRVLRNRIIAAGGLSALLLASVVTVAIGRQGDSAEPSPVLRWGYYVTWESSSRTSLEQHFDQLDVVSPYYYHLTPSGTLKSFAEADVLAEMHSSGVKIVPLIQNESQWDEFHTTIETPEKRAAIVSSLVELVDANGYDGINIDFEAVNASDASLLTDFMTQLYAAFHPRGWIVSQAVIARVSDQSSTWGGAYNYKELAAVNDYVVVMAYDYTGASAAVPGPVAPISWVQRVVDYTVSRIPREKTLLGIPLYGYDWDTKTGPPAVAVSYPAAQTRAALPDASTGYSKDDGAPWIKYKDAAGDPHFVWFENADSFQEKLNIATDAHLAGFAAWRIGHEDPADWTIIGSLTTPATRVAPTEDEDDRIYFPETGHTLAYGFLEYWRDHGGLARFGYPRTEEFDEFDPMVGKTYTVQYFERARFEYHPEYAGTDAAVLLGQVGRWALEQEDIDPWATAADPAPGARYFSESGHNLSGAFRGYWEANGGLMAFGYPLSEEMTETNQDDGATYTVQYFERARFEYHPEYAGTSSEVLLGLLGNMMLRQRGWIR